MKRLHGIHFLFACAVVMACLCLFPPSAQAGFVHVDIQTNQVGRVRATLEDYLSYWSVDVLDLERIVVSDGPVNKTDMDYLASIAADPRSNLVRLDLSGTSFFETAGENDLLGNDVLEGCSLEYLALPSTGAFYAIGERALKDCPNLRRVEAAGAVSVGDEAFMGCEQLQDAVIPNARRIGDRAFFSCVGLETVDMALVEHIGEEAFLDCAVKALHMPWAEEIGDGAFLNCPVEYADMMRLTTLGDRAFYGNTHLLEIHLPNVQVVGKSAFEGCASVSMYTLEMGKVRAVRDNAFKGVTKLTALLMPKVQSVGAEAFRASEIRSVHMPEVKAVSDRAFYGCDQLEEIEIADAESIGASAFEECAALASLNAKSVQSIGPSAFSGCVSLAQANVKSVRTIGAQAFRGCALSGISLPNVTDIGQGAFENCLLLDDVIWPDTQVVLGLSAFSGCAFDFTAGYGCLGNPADAVTDDNVADYAARQAPKMMLRLDPPDGGRNIVQESAFQMPAAGVTTKNGTDYAQVIGAISSGRWQNWLDVQRLQALRDAGRLNTDVACLIEFGGDAVGSVDTRLTGDYRMTYSLDPNAYARNFSLQYFLGVFEKPAIVLPPEEPDSSDAGEPAQEPDVPEENPDPAESNELDQGGAPPGGDASAIRWVLGLFILSGTVTTALGIVFRKEIFDLAAEAMEN